MGTFGTYTSDEYGSPRMARMEEIKRDILRTFTHEDGTVVTYTDVRVTNAGHNLWSVVRYNGEPQYIRLDLITITKGEYYNKPMDESCGPYEADCPLSLLAIVPDPKSSYSTEWRARVQAHHAERKERMTLRKSLAVGLGVLIDGRKSATVWGFKGRKVLVKYDGLIYHCPITRLTLAGEG